jgi:translation initiation factor 4E
VGRDARVSHILLDGDQANEIRGGRFTIKLVQPITPILFETLLFGMIGDQFEESDSVVGCVVSKRSPDGDILSVWVEGEGESVKSGQLRYAHQSSTVD